MTPIGASDSVPDARLRFITGKGGSGKTTVAVAYAALASAESGRVLAVDTLNRGDLAPQLAAVGSGSSGMAPAVLGLTTKDSLDEYIKQYLKFPIAPSSLGPLSRIFDFVSTAAPGVKEILTIGKIGFEAVNGPWDDVVVDAPSSGHVIEMLNAPVTLGRLAPTGPLASQTQWLQELLESGTTAVTVVATPEELPVAETAQLLTRLESETEVAVDTLVINRVPPPVPAIDAERVADSATAGSDQPRPALQVLIEVAIDRAKMANPFVEELRALAAAHQLRVVEIVDAPDQPVATAVSALTGGGTVDSP